MPGLLDSGSGGIKEVLPALAIGRHVCLNCFGGHDNTGHPGVDAEERIRDIDKLHMAACRPAHRRNELDRAIGGRRTIDCQQDLHLTPSGRDVNETVGSVTDLDVFALEHKPCIAWSEDEQAAWPPVASTIRANQVACESGPRSGWDSWSIEDRLMGFGAPVPKVDPSGAAGHEPFGRADPSALPAW